jgi:hypothetical protein
MRTRSSLPIRVGSIVAESGSDGLRRNDLGEPRKEWRLGAVRAILSSVDCTVEKLVRRVNRQVERFHDLEEKVIVVEVEHRHQEIRFGLTHRHGCMLAQIAEFSDRMGYLVEDLAIREFF